MTNNSKKHILICGALPYANGSLHVGHVAALLAGDIIARYHRLQGDEVLYVSGSDQHGTPIAIRADKEKTTPKKIADFYHDEFLRDFKKLGFSYDLFSKTTAPEHAELVKEFFLDLYEKKVIYTKTQALLYCPSCSRSLPDRYVEGICPKCNAEGARGDQCDECGSLLDPTELIDPKCKTCGTTPELRDSEHFYLKLSQFSEFLNNYIKTEGPAGHWRTNAINFSLGLLGEGVPDRAITRDTEWGVEIPIPGYETKKIYVWFEAVLGYLSASKIWAKKLGKPTAWEPFWTEGSNRIYVHGKDNIPFHTIILPSILHAQGNLGLPTQVLSSEYVTLEGKQLSTSRNWAVWIPDFLENYDPDSLRYFCTANGPETSDSDFSWAEFVERNNSDLVGTYGNFIHRTLTFTNNNFGDRIPEHGELDVFDNELLFEISETFKKTGEYIELGQLRKALKEVFNLARLGNQYVDKKAPWKQVKEDQEAAATTLWVCAQVVSALAVLSEPFLPRSAKVLKETLNLENLAWEQTEIKSGHKFNEPKPLFSQLDKSIIELELQKLENSK